MPGKHFRVEVPSYWMNRLADLGALLAQRNQQFTVVVIGGVALAAHGVRVDAPTIDVDVIATRQRGAIVPGMPLPPELIDAAAIVALEHGLAPDWFNAQSSGEFAAGLPLPDGMIERAVPIDLRGLSILIADRQDLVALKLHAAVDNFSPRMVNEKHRDDLRQLRPTSDELAFAVDWLRTALADRPNAALLAAEIIEDDDLG